MRGNDAMLWQFEFDADTGRKRIDAEYWRTDGTDYLIYGSGPVADFATTKKYVDYMVERARP